MSIRLTILTLLIFCGIFSCEEAVDRPIAAKDTGLLVVEGVITNERKNHNITLTLPYKTQNGVAPPATGALLKLSVDSISYHLTEFPQGSGKYYTPVMRAVTGKTYTLTIEYMGKRYTAKDGSVPVEPLNKLQYQKTGDQYSLLYHPTGSTSNFIEYAISWKNTAACLSDSTCEGKIVYYDLKTIDVNELFKPLKENFTFPPNSIVVRKKYSVSQAYKVFLRGMLSETEWRGSLFDIDRANVPTNLSQGAAGFFAVSTVVSDTTIIR